MTRVPVLGRVRLGTFRYVHHEPMCSVAMGYNNWRFFRIKIEDNNDFSVRYDRYIYIA